MAKSKAHSVRASLLWTTGGAAILTLFAYSSLTRWGVVALCTVGALAFILAAVEHGWLWKAPSSLNKSMHVFGKPIRAFLVLAVIIGAMTGLGILVYPPIRRHDLDTDERETFKHELESQKANSPLIQIACPLSDEKICAYANQFLPLFGESGWKVQPFVQRIMLSRAINGIHIRRRGGNKEFLMQHWDAGAYFAINEAHVLAVHNAFKTISIEVDGSTDPDLPEEIMMIYFGPEREDESRPTCLTEDIQWWEKGAKDPFPQHKNGC